MSAIECKGIKKSYGDEENRVEVLKNINIAIKPGELTLLVGPSGSGKTTLISIMATILKPDAGELIVLDQNVEKMDEDQKANFRRENIGFVFQSLFLIPTLSVAENIALPLLLNGETEEIAQKKVIDLLETVKLANRADVSPTHLSKGQQQKVAILRALINGAKIVICDEPTSALDHVAGFEIMEFLKNIAKEASRAVVVVTHDSRIFPYGDTIIQMSDGEINKG